MVYNIYVTDIAGKPIPGATVAFKAGGVVWKMLTANNAGYTSIDNVADNDLLSSDVTVYADAPGYEGASGPATAMQPDTQFQLVRKVNAPLLIAGGAAAALIISGLLSPKKKRRVSGFWDDIDPKVKAGMVIVAGLGVYYYLSKDNSPKKLPATAKAELDQLASQGIVPTFGATEAEAYSNTLTAAFAGCGTDEATVYNVFSNLKNKADLLLLIYIYDIRSYQGCFEGMIWEEAVSANLSQALSNELSSGELAKVNSILSSNGIQFSF